MKFLRLILEKIDGLFERSARAEIERRSRKTALRVIGGIPYGR
jgi:hypothetical protein